jgi:hypothetical protein
MTADEKAPEGFSLKRWSRVKLEKTRAPSKAPATETASDVTQPGGTAFATGPVVPPPAAVVPANATELVAPSPGAAPAELPPIESLTIDSDFTAFLQPKVDEALKRKALKKLFGDPHFNVMDRLDVYIDDYSQPDPLAPEIARQLMQARAILDAKPTRINAQGVLEDVPPAEPETAAAPIAQGPVRAERSIADPATTNATAPAPVGDAEPSARAAERATSTDFAPGGDPKAAADSR